MKLRWFFLAAVVTFYTNVAQAEEDRCKDVLANGVWEYSFNESDAHNVSAFLNWYKSASSSSATSSKKQSLEGGIVYDGAPVKLGLSNDQQQNEQFFSKVDALNSGYEQYDTSLVQFVKSASPVIAKAWSDCMSAQGAGINASLKFTGNPKDLLLNLAFRPIDQTKKATLRIDAPKGLRCGKPTISILSNVSTVVRCTRGDGAAGAILLSSAIRVVPDNSLPYSRVRFPRSGPYGTCAVTEEIRNGKDTAVSPETVSTGADISGGGPQSVALHLEVPDGYLLGDVQEHCTKNAGDRPCAFVIPQPVNNPPFTIAGRSVDWAPSNNSDSVTVSITGSKSKVMPGFDRKPNGSIKLSYGKSFSVEFPNTALDVKLQCDADGNSRIYSMSDVEAKGEQIYLKGIRQTATGRVFDLAVAPYDVGSEQ